MSDDIIRIYCKPMDHPKVCEILKCILIDFGNYPKDYNFKYISELFPNIEVCYFSNQKGEPIAGKINIDELL